MVSLKRILIISSEFPPGPGGIGTHAFQIARFLSEEGVMVRVIASQDYAFAQEVSKFNLSQPFPIKSFKRSQNPIKKAISRLNDIRDEIQDFHPDLVLASGSRIVWNCTLALYGKKIPWVAVGHGTEFGSRSWAEGWINQRAYNHADAVICVSEYTRTIMQDMGITRPLSYVVHNGADPESFFPMKAPEIKAFRKDVGADNKFILLTVGSVSDRKGQDLVIRALPEIISAVPNVEYWMAGMPYKKQKISHLAEKLGVEERIRFWGRVSDAELLKIYNSSDLFLMTSRTTETGDFEGYGIAVIEAALCGKPSIVSADSGLVEAVADDQTGLLIPQNDVHAVARAVACLVQNPQKRIQMGAKAYNSAAIQKTWRQVGQKYFAILQEILANK